MYDHLQLPDRVPGLVRLCSSSEEGVQRTVAATLANLAYGSRENQLRQQTYNLLVGQVWSWWSFSSTTKSRRVLDVSGCILCLNLACVLTI